ncbi:hypothetical protein [Leptolyngbya sp. FACHB-261]|uniref:hypothetical protein n=1 Tax=Leptolyngbya sp. FACHB-261 TaxID=2692806 RepID=UPI0018F059C6|nr:hypothetical protein [Leptolyngbya sp. FACHB-261]
MRQTAEPIWLPELNLGIGRGHGTYEGWQREWLYWYDAQGQRFATPEEAARQERQRAERLADLLRARGIDPDSLS